MICTQMCLGEIKFRIKYKNHECDGLSVVYIK